MRGIFLCSNYINETDLKALAKRIYIKGINLPAFTLTIKTDKYTINRARFNIHSLLIPVHDRKVAMDEFEKAAKAWRNLSGKGDSSSITYFCFESITRKIVDECIKEYIR